MASLTSALPRIYPCPLSTPTTLKQIPRSFAKLPSHRVRLYLSIGFMNTTKSPPPSLPYHAHVTKLDLGAPTGHIKVYQGRALGPVPQTQPVPMQPSHRTDPDAVTGVFDAHLLFFKTHLQCHHAGSFQIFSHLSVQSLSLNHQGHPVGAENAGGSGETWCCISHKQHIALT